MTPLDKYLASVKARTCSARRLMRRICADVRTLAPVFKFVLPASVERIETEIIMGGAASAAGENVSPAPPTIFEDIDRLVAMVKAARKALDDVTWHARPDCLPALHIAEKALAELDRIASCHEVNP